MPNGWPTVTIHLDGKASLTEQERIIEVTEVQHVAKLHSLAREFSSDPEELTNVATFERTDAPQKLGQLAIREITTAHTLGALKSAELAQGRRFVLEASIYVESRVTQVAVFR